MTEPSPEAIAFFREDTRNHQRIVLQSMIKCITILLDRASTHDASKLTPEEETFYAEPVFALNTQGVEYGSERYKELAAQMGAGWTHHKMHNDHHPEHTETGFSGMSLFSLMEMVCDWIAAASRKGNDPELALEHLNRWATDQLCDILRNTLKELG